MDDNFVKIVSFSILKIVWSYGGFSSNFPACKAFNNKRILNRCYKIKTEILQLRRFKYARFKDLVNRMKALEEKL